MKIRDQETVNLGRRLELHIGRYLYRRIKPDCKLSYILEDLGAIPGGIRSIMLARRETHFAYIRQRWHCEDKSQNGAIQNGRN